MTRDEASIDGVERLGLLASALSGRALRVNPGKPGEPSWTDGETIFVDPSTDKRRRLEALAVQASLLAAGSLEPDVVRRFARRPTLARRYLAIEGHRALAANEPLLPRALLSLIDPQVAGCSDSPAASLAAALSRNAIADPPSSFGTIRVRPLLASSERGDVSTSASRQAPHRPPSQEPTELEEEESDDGTAVDFSSPVGGGGAFGRLLGRMLSVVRQLTEGGPPGVDAPTHRMRSAPRGRSTPALSTATQETREGRFLERHERTYPEWDLHRRRYRPDWCTVLEIEPQAKDGLPLLVPDRHGLHRPLARLGIGLDRCRRRAQGDDIDIDAAVEARVAIIAGAAPDEAVYVESLRRRRDLAVLLLLDISGSVGEPGASGETVHEHQRAVAAALTAALHDLGDRVALYAFRSQGRSAVHLVPVKRFDDRLDALVRRRLGSLVPGAYSRLGAAIRHGAAVLERRAGTPRRLLVVLSDGLAYDHGYEPAYGAADARRALAEARGRGTGCLCLSIGASTDVEALQRVFGSTAHAKISGPEQLSPVIGPLFRSALRSAEVRRSRSGRRSSKRGSARRAD